MNSLTTGCAGRSVKTFSTATKSGSAPRSSARSVFVREAKAPSPRNRSSAFVCESPVSLRPESSRMQVLSSVPSELPAAHFRQHHVEWNEVRQLLGNRATSWQSVFVMRPVPGGRYVAGALLPWMIGTYEIAGTAVRHLNGWLDDERGINRALIRLARYLSWAIHHAGASEIPT